MSQLIERGRWGTIRPARIYVNDGLAKIMDLELTKAESDFITEQILGVHRSPKQILGGNFDLCTSEWGVFWGVMSPPPFYSSFPLVMPNVCSFLFILFRLLSCAVFAVRFLCCTPKTGVASEYAVLFGTILVVNRDITTEPSDGRRNQRPAEAATARSYPYPWL